MLRSLVGSEMCIRDRHYLHWLRAPQRIQFKLAVFVYLSLHGMAPPYLADQFLRVADFDSRRRLRSASTTALVVPPTRHRTINDCAFSFGRHGFGMTCRHVSSLLVTLSVPPVTCNVHFQLYNLCKVSQQQTSSVLRHCNLFVTNMWHKFYDRSSALFPTHCIVCFS